MPIPDVQNAVIADSKIIGYLLNLSHRDGGPKARWFVARGFDPDVPESFRQAFLEHARNNDVVEETKTEHGTKYNVQCYLNTPHGEQHCCLAVWLVEPEQGPRLITAYYNGP